MVNQKVVIIASIVWALAAIFICSAIVGYAGYNEHNLRCTDSDGGDIRKMPGTVIVYTTTGMHTYADKCVNKDQILEGICINNKYSTRVHGCPYGCNVGDGEAFCQSTEDYDSWAKYQHA